MSGPSLFLPFFSASEEGCLRDATNARIRGISTSAEFYNLLLSNFSEFPNLAHKGLGDREVHEEIWQEDGYKQYPGLVRRIRFKSAVKGAPTLDDDQDVGKSFTRVEEEQHLLAKTRSGGATLEIRRTLRDLVDGDRFKVIARWLITFDGIGSSIRLQCGVHFTSESELAATLSVGCVKGYSYTFEKWCRLAERYARRMVPSQYRKKEDLDLKPQYAQCSPFVSDNIASIILGDEPDQIVLVERQISENCILEVAQLDYVDDPGGLPEEYWGKVNNRLTRWLEEGLGEDREKEALLACADEDDPLWLAQVEKRGYSHLHKGADGFFRDPSDGGSITLGGLDATDTSSVISELPTLARDLSIAGESEGDIGTPSHKPMENSEEEGAAIASEEESKQQQTPYSVLFSRARLGIQFRSLHGVPVVRSLKGFRSDATRDTDTNGNESCVEDVFRWDAHTEDAAAVGSGGEHSTGTGKQSMGSMGDMQTVYGGTFTESSSALDSSEQYSLDPTIKCIVQCTPVFGQGIKKLWLWRPGCEQVELQTQKGLSLFMLGLAKRLALGGNDEAETKLASERLSVMYIDPEEKEQVSLDLEAWPELLSLRSKRLVVDIDRVMEARSSSLTAPHSLHTEVNHEDRRSNSSVRENQNENDYYSDEEPPKNPFAEKPTKSRSQTKKVDCKLVKSDNSATATGTGTSISTSIGLQSRKSKHIERKTSLYDDKGGHIPWDSEASNLSNDEPFGSEDELLVHSINKQILSLNGCKSSPTKESKSVKKINNVKNEDDFENESNECVSEKVAVENREGNESKVQERNPCIGAVLVSVNGVRTQGLSFQNVIDLLHTQKRPLVLEFVDSWDVIFHSHLIETEMRQKISKEMFEAKLAHPVASRLRKQVNDWMEAFLDQDLHAQCSRYGVESKDNRAPQVMLWSLIRWIEKELESLGVFNNNHKAGVGLPKMGELQWIDVKQHLERHIFDMVFERCLTAAPEYAEGDAAIAYRLASLRFLRPRHWCVDSLDDRGGYGREWELAQRELCRIVHYKCPRDLMGCVRACVRLVALSVEASLAKHQDNAVFGADDLLAALTWVVVQANPPRLGSRMWLMAYFMRLDDDEGIGEGGYCLTQLASAVEFAKECDASVLADITEAELEAGIRAHSTTQTMIEASFAGNEKRVAELLNEGGDPNGLSTDQQNTALTAAVLSSDLGVIKTLLGHRATDPNVTVCPNYGPNRGRTALMLAAQRGWLEAVLLLLRKGRVNRALTCVDGLSAVDYALKGGHKDVASILLADPERVGLVQAVAAGALPYVRALLMQGCDPNAVDSTGQFTPLIVAAMLGQMGAADILLGEGKADVLQRNKRGETALMYCVGRAGRTSPNVQVAFAVKLLAYGADRDQCDMEGRTALDWSERFGSAQLADILRYDPKKIDVFKAAKDRDVRGILALLAQGTNPNARCPRRGYTALVAAVFNQDEDMVRALLPGKRWKFKTDVNCPGRHGMTPLMYAAQAGHEKMVALLLSLRADRYKTNDKGETALDMAMIRRFRSVEGMLRYDPHRLSICTAAALSDRIAVESLMKQGISINSRHRKRDQYGWHHELYSPLIAASSVGNVHMVFWLLTIDCIQVDMPNLLGQTALMYAAAKGNEDILLQLLRAGADRSKLDGTVHNALWYSTHFNHHQLTVILKIDPSKRTIQMASASGAMEDVWALIRQGVPPDEARPIDMLELFDSPETRNVPDIAAKANLYRCSFEPQICTLSPLTAAAIFGRDNVIAGLLGSEEHQLDVDARDHLRRTPLMLAARYGNESTVLRLLHEGANRYKRDGENRAASDFAIQVGHLQIAGIINADPERLSLVDVAAQGKLVLAIGLMKQGVSISAPEVFSRKWMYGTPLIAACANGHEHMVDLLLSKDGLDINQKNEKGETALMRAAQVGAFGICRKLILAGANKKATDNKGFTADHHAYFLSHLNMAMYKAVCSVTRGPSEEEDDLSSPEINRKKTVSSVKRAISPSRSTKTRRSSKSNN